MALQTQRSQHQSQQPPPAVASSSYVPRLGQHQPPADARSSSSSSNARAVGGSSSTAAGTSDASSSPAAPAVEGGSSDSSSSSASTWSTPASMRFATLLFVAALVLGFVVWYFLTQHADATTPVRPPSVRDLTGRTYTLAWTNDPIDPKPLVLATPPVTPGSSAISEPLYTFNSSFDVTCNATAPELKTAIYRSSLAHMQSLNSASLPEGMHPTSLRRLAITRVLEGRGADGSTWVPMQAALWLTPHGLVIGDPKLQSKVNAGRLGGSEVLRDYTLTTAPNSNVGGAAAGAGGKTTTPLELRPPAALATSDLALNRLLEFRTSPYAFWNIHHGSLVNALDEAVRNTYHLRWPFYPTTLDTKVIWSHKTLTDTTQRVLEFLDNGDLRIVDRSLHDGSLVGSTKWLASADVRATQGGTANGCSLVSA